MEDYMLRERLIFAKKLLKYNIFTYTDVQINITKYLHLLTFTANYENCTILEPTTSHMRKLKQKRNSRGNSALRGEDAMEGASLRRYKAAVSTAL